MELIKPGIGLLFWMLVSFGIVFYILKKFAWPAILKILKERENSITDSLKAAEKAREEIKQLKNEYDRIIARAKTERDTLIAESMEMKEQIILEAKHKANAEANNIIKKAKITIENEKASAINELKVQVASISIEIAEKILRERLGDAKDHQKMIDHYLEDFKFN
ncbi:MAG: F0F1 ATP synthase subunit B [Bacteroidales bacterium]|nr:F0F1 ATP synthase subunit B [Bacteroidales bacterium]